MIDTVEAIVPANFLQKINESLLEGVNQLRILEAETGKKYRLMLKPTAEGVIQLHLESAELKAL